jgi:hypothetical protein
MAIAFGSCAIPLVDMAAGHLSYRLANVIGLDLSQGMVDRARRMFGDRIRFECADLREPLAFLDSHSIDVLTALGAHAR